MLAFRLVSSRLRRRCRGRRAYPAAGSCTRDAGGASPPRACDQWPGCASSARHPRGWSSCRCPWCLVVAAAGRRKMLGADGRGFGGSTRPSASPQGSRLRASLGRRDRDSVSVLESAWQARRRRRRRRRCVVGRLRCVGRGEPGDSDSDSAADGSAGRGEWGRGCCEGRAAGSGRRRCWWWAGGGRSQGEGKGEGEGCAARCLFLFVVVLLRCACRRV